MAIMCIGDMLEMSKKEGKNWLASCGQQCQAATRQQRPVASHGHDQGITSQSRLVEAGAVQ
jgi:hypothetical protein